MGTYHDFDIGATSSYDRFGGLKNFMHTGNSAGGLAAVPTTG